MDNITHTLIGVTAANAGLKQKFGRGTTLVLAVASNITDIDIFGRFFSSDPSFVYRRMFTHSLFSLPLLALALAFFFRLFYKNLSLKTLFGLCLLGAGLHVLFDVFNSYGVVLLYPFSRARFELAWLFIIDLMIWFFLLAPFLFQIPKLFGWRGLWNDLQQLSRLSIRCLVIYVVACSVFHARAGQILDHWIEQHQIKPSFFYVFPEALGPHRFRGVVREGNVFKSLLIHVFSGHAHLAQEIPTDDSHPQLADVLRTRMGQKLDWFFKAPVWVCEPGPRSGESLWKVHDLRFQSLVLNRRNPFAYQFLVNEEGVTFIGRARASAVSTRGRSAQIKS